MNIKKTIKDNCNKEFLGDMLGGISFLVLLYVVAIMGLAL